MTLKLGKLGMMAAVLATGLFAGVGHAKADVVQVDLSAARAHEGERVGPWARPWRHRYHGRRGPFAVAPPPPVAPWTSVAPAVAMRGAPPDYRYRDAYGPADPRDAAQDPAIVAMEIRAEADRAADDLRFDVRQGAVEPTALASLAAGREEVERDLAEASAKGYITPADRAHLEEHVQEIRGLREQFRCSPDGRVSYRR